MHFEDEIFLADEKPKARPSTPAIRAERKQLKTGENKQAWAYFERKDRGAKRHSAEVKTTCRNGAKASQGNMHAEAKFTAVNRLAPVKEEILYFNEDEDALYEENVEEMQALRQKARVSEKGLFNDSATSIMPDSLNTPDDCTHPFSIDYYEVK